MMTIATNHELQVKISESMKLDLLKFMSIKIWGSTERVYWNLWAKVYWNLECLEICGSTEIRGSESWRSTEIWGTEIQRVYWDTKRKPEEPMVYWDLEDLLKSQASLFHLYSQHNFGRAARVWNHFPCIFPQKTHFFSGALRASPPPCLHPTWPFSSPCPYYKLGKCLNGGHASISLVCSKGK